MPANLFDTQLAAGFLGYSTPSLVSLLQAELKVTAAKGDRLTDWLRRPLTADQCDYAAADVAHLLALHDRLITQLAEAGRMEWVDAACEELLRKPVSGTNPDMAWTRLKDVRALKPRARGVAQALAAWRERRAMSVDTPVRLTLIRKPDFAAQAAAVDSGEADLAVVRSDLMPRHALTVAVLHELPVVFAVTGNARVRA